MPFASEVDPPTKPLRGPSPTTGCISWDAFRERYLRESASLKAEQTFLRETSLLKSFGKYLTHRHVYWLDQITPEVISSYITKRREKGAAESSIDSIVARISNCLKWAVRHELLAKVPYIEHTRMRGQIKFMKGRPVTREEFDCILAAVPVNEHTERWHWLLYGLWWSGLRIMEILTLRWPLRAGETWKYGGAMSVDFSRKHVMLKVRAHGDKGKRDRLLPIAPEFERMLLGVPEEYRTGRVFTTPCSIHTTGGKISQFGEKAGIVVDEDSGKFASAHDFRRSFGERWSMLVMPPVLMQLMRHRSIETTLKYYIGANADSVAEAVFEAWSRCEARKTGRHKRA